MRRRPLAVQCGSRGENGEMGGVATGDGRGTALFLTLTVRRAFLYDSPPFLDSTRLGQPILDADASVPSVLG